MKTLYSDLRVELRKLAVQTTPRRRDKSVFIGLTVYGTTRVSGSLGEWQVWVSMIPGLDVSNGPQGFDVLVFAGERADQTAHDRLDTARATPGRIRRAAGIATTSVWDRGRLETRRGPLRCIYVIFVSMTLVVYKTQRRRWKIIRHHFPSLLHRPSFC